jgi:excisionase family DNA binding protein
VTITQPLLKSKDVAHILDCSPDDVALLAQKNELKGTKQGRLWKFHPQDVAAYKHRVEQEDHSSS